MFLLIFHTHTHTHLPLFIAKLFGSEDGNYLTPPSCLHLTDDVLMGRHLLPQKSQLTIIKITLMSFCAPIVFVFACFMSLFFHKPIFNPKLIGIAYCRVCCCFWQSFVIDWGTILQLKCNKRHQLVILTIYKLLVMLVWFFRYIFDLDSHNQLKGNMDCQNWLGTKKFCNVWICVRFFGIVYRWEIP